MTRLFPLLTVLALLPACTRQPTIKSNVDLDQLIKGKSKALPDRQEAIPNTYFELTAWTGDTTRTPETVTSATGTLASASQVACGTAIGSANTGRCEITISGAKYTLKAGDAMALKGSGEIGLSCSGTAPTLCKALVVN